MGAVLQFEKQKLVIPVLFARGTDSDRVKEALEMEFGEIDYESRPIPFTFTDFYTREMGPDIRRIFFAFQTLINPSCLASIKLLTNELEQAFASGGKRTVNLDPGVLSLSRFILATTKNQAHRIPLSDGIYGEVTLLYRRKDFQHLSWTYPDYRTGTYKAVLREIREIYRKNLKQQAS